MANDKKKSGAKKAGAAKKVAAKKPEPPAKKPEPPAVVEIRDVPLGNTLPTIFEGMAEAGIEHSEFELKDPEESDSNLQSWLGAMPKDGSRVIVFAQDGTGSLFGVWLRPHHADVENAPVIYLGSEGETAVLGKNPRAFIESLGSAMSFDGHSGMFFSTDDDDDEDGDDDVRERRKRAASFAKQVLGIESLRKPGVIKAEAERAYRDLQAWIDANNAHR